VWGRQAAEAAPPFTKPGGLTRVDGNGSLKRLLCSFNNGSWAA